MEGERVLEDRKFVEDLGATRAGRLLQAHIASVSEYEEGRGCDSSVQEAGTNERVLITAIARALANDRPMPCGLPFPLPKFIAICNLSGEKLILYGKSPSLLRRLCTRSSVMPPREVAQSLRTDHHETILDEAMFLSTWRESVTQTGLPACTPNEVAIRLIARSLRGDGQIVALTGEGADELFGGYELPLRLASEHVATGNPSPGRFQLESNAWYATDMKRAVLQPGVWREVENDEAIAGVFERLFEQSREHATSELIKLLKTVQCADA